MLLLNETTLESSEKQKKMEKNIPEEWSGKEKSWRNITAGHEHDAKKTIQTILLVRRSLHSGIDAAVVVVIVIDAAQEDHWVVYHTTFSFGAYNMRRGDIGWYPASEYDEIRVLHKNIAIYDTESDGQKRKPREKDRATERQQRLIT